jgi:hypothetical protein
MSIQKAPASVMAAVIVPCSARAARPHLHDPGFPMTDREVHRRAEMIEKVIRARRKLQSLRERTQALESALGRFKARREAMRA